MSHNMFLDTSLNDDVQQNILMQLKNYVESESKNE